LFLSDLTAGCSPKTSATGSIQAHRRAVNRIGKFLIPCPNVTFVIQMKLIVNKSDDVSG
jgi:hypothetical protein